MRQEVALELDRIDKLRAGTGALEAYAGLRGDLTQGWAGGGLQYSHKLNSSSSVFGRGTIGYEYGDEYRLTYDALMGYRRTW
jgi:hypothetical protein